MAKSKNLGNTFVAVLVALVILGGYSYYALQRPLPDLKPIAPTIQANITTGTPKLDWPSEQSAVTLDSSPTVITHGSQVALPTASTAKVITALSVLHEKPLSFGQTGPVLTMHDADIAFYNDYAAQDGSILTVVNGEQISEYQVLEAMMLPSANNLADSLATWAFGSLSAYSKYANQYVKQLGLTDTHIGTDASGFSPTTTSTAHDLAIVGKLAMQNPVLAQIVAEPSSTDIPGASSVENVNFLLGSNNIVGVKTGNTEQAGGVYISASNANVAGRKTTIITSIIGSPSLYEALHDSLPLITSAQVNFTTATLFPKQTIVGEYKQSSGADLPAVTQTNLTAQAWRGLSISTSIKLQPVAADATRGQIVGTVNSADTSYGVSSQANIILDGSPTKPSAFWRLTHPIR